MFAKRRVFKPVLCASGPFVILKTGSEADRRKAPPIANIFTLVATLKRTIKMKFLGLKV
jgi:hypothetical protein